MYSNINIEKILFLDIETVPQYAEYKYLTDDIKHLWDRKAESLARYETYAEEPSPEYLYSRAGIYAEFGKVVCVSAAFIRDGKLYVKSYTSHCEEEILSAFAELVTKHFGTAECRLCGHNLKEFDLPYLCRRMIVNGVPIPKTMNLMGQKSWNNPHIDTLDMWKFGDYKHYTSLELLATTMGIPSPKDDIDGSEVATVYWNDKDLARIAAYCEKDTITVAQLFLKMTGREPIKQDNIIIK
jgi:uncharacterized protein YprB with RNaseH-like and TPR domain